MRAPAPLPACLDDRLSFTVADARALEVGAPRLRRSDLVAPFHGVRSRTVPGTMQQRAAVYLPRMAPGQVFSHVTAAVLLGLPIPRGMTDGPVDVAAVYPAQSPRTAGVLGHRLLPRPGLLEEQAWYPVTGRAETWAALGAGLAVAQLVVVGDHLVRRGVERPQEMLVEMERAMRVVRRTGIRRLERALSLVRPGVRSPMESLVRAIIVSAGLPEPFVNLELFRRDGAFLGEGDMVYPEQRQVLEYEGDHHRTDEKQWAKDLRRREDFEDEGWSVMRISKDDVFRHRAEMLQRIARRLGLS